MTLAYVHIASRTLYIIFYIQERRRLPPPPPKKKREKQIHVKNDNRAFTW